MQLQSNSTTLDGGNERRSSRPSHRAGAYLVTESPVPEEPEQNQAGESMRIGDVDIPQRVLSVPINLESRRVTKSGTVGAQRSTREVFNRKYALHMGTEYHTKNPLTEEMIRSAAAVARAHLYSTDKGFMGLHRGQVTYRGVEFEYAGQLDELRKKLNKRFPILQMAVNYWASEWIIKEVLRRDRLRKNAGSRARRSSYAPSQDDREERISPVHNSESVQRQREPPFRRNRSMETGSVGAPPKVRRALQQTKNKERGSQSRRYGTGATLQTRNRRVSDQPLVRKQSKRRNEAEHEPDGNEEPADFQCNTFVSRKRRSQVRSAPRSRIRFSDDEYEEIPVTKVRKKRRRLPVSSDDDISLSC